MSLDISFITNLLIVLLAITGAMIGLLFFSKHQYRRRNRKKTRMSKLIIDGVLKGGGETGLLDQLKRDRKLMFKLLKEIGDSVELPASVKAKLVEGLRERKLEKSMIGQLDAMMPLKRIRAAMGLGVIGGTAAEEAMYNRLTKEPKWFIRLALVHSLVRLEYTPVIPVIFSFLPEAPHWFREKVIAVLPVFGEELERHLKFMIETGEGKNRGLLFELADRFPSAVLNQYLQDSLNSKYPVLRRRAAAVLEKSDPSVMYGSGYLHDKDLFVRVHAVRSLASKPGEAEIDFLLGILDSDQAEERRAARYSLGSIITAEPKHLEKLLDRFMDTGKRLLKQELARVLESRLEYILYRVKTDRYWTVVEVIKVLIQMRRVAVLFGFFERNQDLSIEKELIEIIQGLLEKDHQAQEMFSRYMPEHNLKQLGLERSLPENTREKAPMKKQNRRLLVGLFVLILISMPLIYFLSMAAGGGLWDSLFSGKEGTFSLLKDLILGFRVEGFVSGFNYIFAYYSIALNSIYFLLLLLALIHLFKQFRYWEISSLRFLFSEELLPSISILAPAYNEELNVVDNVKSLLNLHYPDVEVIVINDGSGDGTLSSLIETFELERVDIERRNSIPTEPVRGIYRSRSYSNLTVIDKANGGKADSLNAGINLAGKDYICTIDSDSLLEHEALLKIAYHTVLTDEESVALGGNILPANGCSIRNGRLTSINLSKDHLARFQTIEYMRAFLAGRLGWSLINSMVIISGAFGLFIRKRVVEVGGYMTPKSRMETSTVGEDMELVVRLHEHLRKKKIRYKVFDAFNANCWTEVPGRFKILYRQRDRWHRGLIESILLHKKIMSNPRYGPIGMVAFPYFLLFEVIGPFFEMYGYINLAISLVLGLIHGPIILFLFVAVILYGILLSVGSIMIAENDVLYFNYKETFQLIGYAVLENFGFRQIMSFVRVFAYVSFIFKEKSWGVMERSGLGKKTTAVSSSSSTS